MRLIRVLQLAVVLAVVAVAALVLLAGHPRPVAGTARPADPPPADENSRQLLSRCSAAFKSPSSDIDIASLRPGPAVPYGDGQLVVATAPNGMIVHCHTGSGGAGTNGPYRIPPGAKVVEIGEGQGGRPDFYGLGWAAPDVARVEVELPDKRIIQARVAGGTFVYTAALPAPDLRVTLRAYDVDGNLIDERQCPCLP